jgi:hypothetical protein
VKLTEALMKLKLFLVLTILILSIAIVSCGNGEETTLPEESGISTEPMETEPEETEPPHVHDYKVINTVAGTCVDEGFEEYGCECGITYRNLIPSAHKYVEVKDSTGKYVKKTCSLCGDYKIVKLQSYLFNMTYEGFDSVKDATNAQKNLEYYTISSADKTKGDVEIRSNVDGNYIYVHECNYCVWENTRSITSKKIVVSMDVMFESYPRETLNLFSVSYRNSKGKETYNSGIVLVGTDGSLYVSGSKEPLSVKLKNKGYNNITIVYNPTAGLADVYVDEKLERKDVVYIVPPADVSKSYIRYFDRKVGFAALADNLKAYVADAPEFVVPSGLTFKK